jgi:hypothetical protein
LLATTTTTKRKKEELSPNYQIGKKVDTYSEENRLCEGKFKKSEKVKKAESNRKKFAE